MMTDAELFAWRDRWLADNPWYADAEAAIAEYRRALRAINPVVIITQTWRDGELVDERREVLDH